MMGSSVEIAAAAIAYVRAGWAVIPLHDVTGGICSCGSEDEPNHSANQGGKHPLWGRWQNAGLRDEAQVIKVFAAHPNANLGIVTGRASGVWVLDVDPKNGGDEQLAALIAAYGRLPETYVVGTGSGGRHYYFLMPDFDFTTSRGRLPLGLDVRGNSGQAVAPPSVTLKGSYRVLVPAPVAAAPAWLLDMIRPAARVEIDLTDVAASARSVAGRDEYSAGDLERGAAYARRAVSALLWQLGEAPPGTRNETAFRVGTRLSELVNSAWSGLDPYDVFDGYMDAAARADVDGGFSQTEARDVLRNAVRRKAGEGVALPEPHHLGQLTDWAPPAGFDDAASNGGVPAIESGEVGPVETRFEKLVRGELGNLIVKQTAARRLAEINAWQQPPIEILDREALAAMAQIEPLIAGWLGRGQTARIYGPPGSGKSFAAVDMAACVAAGRAWHGRAVRAGEVVYFAAEDAEGVALRLRAWETYHETEHAVHVVAGALLLDEAGGKRVLGALVRYFEDRELALIVLDTQAMMTVGLDENSAQDMSVFVAAVKMLAAVTGAAVLIVHHSGVRGGRARGSTSIRAAIDVEIEASMTGALATLSCTKQKNIEAPAALLANLVRVDLDMSDAMGQPVSSCVLLTEADASADSPFIAPAGPRLTSMQRRAVAIATVLVETHATGETYTRVRTRATQLTEFGSSPATVTSAFSKAWAYLIERGRIMKAQGREAFYFIDVEGLDRLAYNPGKKVIGGPEVYVPGDLDEERDDLEISDET